MKVEKSTKEDARAGHGKEENQRKRSNLTLGARTYYMGVRCKNLKRKENKEKWVWALAKPNFYWAFQHVGPGSCWAQIRQLKAQAQLSCTPELPELNEHFFSLNSI